MFRGHLKHAALQQGVVDGDETALSDELQAGFVIMGGGQFVGIDEGEVVVAAVALFDELVEGNECGLQVQADFVCHACGLPELAGLVGVGDVDVAGGEGAVFGECKGDLGAAVACEYADFKAVTRAHQSHQKCQQVDGFNGAGHGSTVCGLRVVVVDLLEDGMGGGVDALQVAFEFAGGIVARLACAHAGSVGLVGVGFFWQFGRLVTRLFFGVEFNIPQQAAVVETALCFFRVLFEVFLQKLGGIGLVVVHFCTP